MNTLVLWFFYSWLHSMTHSVLLVDNDPDFRQQAKQSLQRAGYRVTEADGERFADEIARNKKFDIAVVNLVLENSDGGFTLSDHLKKDNPDMPIILLSSSVMNFGVEFSLESSAERAWIKADLLLNKPVRMEQLLQSVRQLLPQ